MIDEEILADLSAQEAQWVRKHLLASPPTPEHIKQEVANRLARQARSSPDPIAAVA